MLTGGTSPTEVEVAKKSVGKPSCPGPETGICESLGTQIFQERNEKENMGSGEKNNFP